MPVVAGSCQMLHFLLFGSHAFEVVEHITAVHQIAERTVYGHIIVGLQRLVESIAIIRDCHLKKRLFAGLRAKHYIEIAVIEIQPNFRQLILVHNLLGQEQIIEGAAVIAHQNIAFQSAVNAVETLNLLVEG